MIRALDPLAAAASPLADRFSALMPRRPVICNLGGELGRTFRALAPVIARAQAWIFVESDEEQLGFALDATASWAGERGWTVTWPGRALLLHRPGGAWRVEGMVADLAEMPPEQMRRADGVVSGAFLERLPASRIGRFASMLRSPLLVCDIADGRLSWRPRDPADPIVARWWRRALARDTGSGPALGADAAATIRRALATRGFAVTTAPSGKRIPDRSPLSLDLVQEIASAAREVAGPSAARIADWEVRRKRLALRRRLGVTIGQSDLLAAPR